MKIFCKHFILLIFFLNSPWSLSRSIKSQPDKDKAIVFLKRILNKYKTQNIHFKIEKESFLPSVNHLIKERGDFYFSDQKFRLQMKGSPSYLMVFDGTHLWYQPDMTEQIVFKFTQHPQVYLFFALFDSKKFFEYFSVYDFTKKSSNHYVFHLHSQGKIKGIKEIFITIRKYIEESHVVWSDLNQWQKYKFLNPWVKKSFPQSRFQFLKPDFEVISKDLL